MDREEIDTTTMQYVDIMHTIHHLNIVKDIMEEYKNIVHDIAFLFGNEFEAWCPVVWHRHPASQSPFESVLNWIHDFDLRRTNPPPGIYSMKGVLKIINASIGCQTRSSWIQQHIPLTAQELYLPSTLIHMGAVAINQGAWRFEELFTTIYTLASIIAKIQITIVNQRRSLWNLLDQIGTESTGLNIQHMLDDPETHMWRQSSPPVTRPVITVE